MTGRTTATTTARTATTAATTTAATITGIGAAVPDRVVTNADFEARLDTTDEWIVERTGIRERRHAGPDDTTASLAIAAGAAAIKDAGLVPDQIDLVIVATATPEQPLPATSAYVQDGLGLRCGAFDLAAACSGFVYGLVTASSLVQTGALQAVLVIGAETLSRIVDPEDRGTCILFGDGAGAVVVQPVENGTEPGTERGLLAWDLGCDGSAAGILEVPAGGSRRPTTAETVAEGGHFVHMEGREVFRRAVRAVVDSSSRTLADAGMAAADVDWFVPHQANRRIIDAATERLGLPAERVVVNLDRYGNTSAASIPLALAEADLHDGDVVLLSGFGAGMTWASALLRWGTGR
ncbi:MAG TPA: beta-ketoacyl-ACP synthase III [Acidimicrobiales bacterium]|nr:beta-ketoacyl-ACP synthase III [Acidimicrobiales bacterium]